ncbi:hypothetical protein OY671_008503, partial [Metschnikowia pulcherrima]
FAQTHYYVAPVWKMLDMFTDSPCIEDNGFDVAMITEVSPTWQSGTSGAIIQPEGILFGNPAAGLACIADSAAAAAGKVIDPLFWCMGSWGATYPVAGDIHFDDSVEAWAGLAARTTFMMGRLGSLTISSADGCSFKPQPIWTKSRYKFQIMEPVKGSKCVNVGRPGALWTSGKHAPGKDNAHGSPTANRTRTSQSRRSVRHEARERAAAVRAAGAAAVPPAAAAPTPVSAATLPPPGQAVAPIATAPVVAASTT